MIEKSTDMDFMKSLQERIKKHKDCKGYGYILKDNKQEMCECRSSALYQYRLSQSRIPSQFRKMDFKDCVFKESNAYKKVQEYLETSEQNKQDGSGLFLFGPSYTGKTLLACSLLMGLMKKGYSCRYFKFGQLLDVGQQDVIKKEIYSPDFLCVDEVERVLNNLVNFRDSVLTGDRIHGAVEFLDNLLSMRIDSGLPVIAASTVSLKTINGSFPSLARTFASSCISIECEFKKKIEEQTMMPDQT